MFFHILTGWPKGRRAVQMEARQGPHGNHQMGGTSRPNCTEPWLIRPAWWPRTHLETSFWLGGEGGPEEAVTRNTIREDLDHQSSCSSSLMFASPSFVTHIYIFVSSFSLIDVKNKESKTVCGSEIDFLSTSTLIQHWGELVKFPQLRHKRSRTEATFEVDGFLLVESKRLEHMKKNRL